MGLTDRLAPSLLLAALVVALAWAPEVTAQEASREREQIRRLQGRIQALQQEHAGALAALRGELESARASAAEARMQADALARDLATQRRQQGRSTGKLRELAAQETGLREERVALTTRLATTARERDALATELASIRESAQRASQENATCAAALEGERRQHAACVTRAQALYGLAREVIDRYDAVGLFDRAARSERLLGLGRVKVENEVQAFRDRLEDHRPPPAAPLSPPR